ncbi:hypothetical protein CRG98_038423 [Punica granatum]|uniref:Uncharacterized protein n=1 Tax=Punica granatum TaxID=22663 RepID=A0A2I0IB19_PUNGR|nr:hypothetical protein CRG98_038423 [Punica granatum]
MPQCTSLAEVMLSRASAGDALTSLAEVMLSRASAEDAPVYVACRGRVVASFSRGCPSVRRLPRSCCRELQPGMPQCTSFGSAHHGRMMFEMVSV